MTGNHPSTWEVNREALLWLNISDTKSHTASILNLSSTNKKSTRIRNSQATLKRQMIQQKKISDLYEPLIDQAINIEDQLILLTQLLSTSKLSIDIPIDSICILNRAEYLLNLSRSVFRDVSKLLSQIRDFDLSMPKTIGNNAWTSGRKLSWFRYRGVWIKCNQLLIQSFSVDVSTFFTLDTRL